MRPLRSLRSVPRLPGELDGLTTLANNLWWTWNHPTAELFRSIDPYLWEEVNHNPIALLGRLGQDQVDALSRDDAFRYRLRRELQSFNDYLNRQTWFARAHLREVSQPLVAYFCAEFGLAEWFRIYSGGLGVLAGDHLKAVSDLGIPFVAIGLFYHRGYFQQRLSLDGWQMEGYPYNDATQLPMELIKTGDGKSRHVEVLVGGERTLAQIWRVNVGRLHLYLLDTNIPENPPHLRAITDRLYGGDDNHRLSQEIVLGIGGVRLLAALGIEPDVFHMNEGHAAFLTVERLRRFVKGGMPLEAAVEAVKGSNVFTTHTPVPAGNKAYPSGLLEYHLKPYLTELGITHSELLAYGQIHSGQGDFGTTVFALHFSSVANGVSRLHGVVARQMWQPVYGDIPTEEVPIGHVTNGTHISTWVSDEMADLYDSYVGPRWREEPWNEKAWERIDGVPAAELWKAHERSRERLIGVTRQRLALQLTARHASASEIQAASEVLNTEALTIGFARRVATYKRLLLLLTDAERFTRLLTNPERPVQLLVAGKAHPDDHAGKEFIQKLVRFASQPNLRRHIVFIENYDMYIGRLLTSGVDVWLNNPRRPQEASGTSGMKSALNGGLNLSILDGWWDEAYADAERDGIEGIGWAVGDHETETSDERELDRMDANVLYAVLEREIVPSFYDRSAENVPRDWVRRMKTAIRTLAPEFNTHRMLIDYMNDAYVPVSERRARLAANGWEGARNLCVWKKRVRATWSEIKVLRTEIGAGDVVTSGDEIPVKVELGLAGLEPSDVIVQVAVGRMSLTDISAPMEDVSYTTLKLNQRASLPERAVFEGAFVSELSGHLGVTVRLLPTHPDLMTPMEMGLVKWA